MMLYCTSYDLYGCTRRTGTAVDTSYRQYRYSTGTTVVQQYRYRYVVPVPVVAGRAGITRTSSSSVPVLYFCTYRVQLPTSYRYCVLLYTSSQVYRYYKRRRMWSVLLLLVLLVRTYVAITFICLNV